MNLNARDAYFTRTLSDGRVVDVIPLTYGRARLTISPDLAAVWYLDGF